MVPVPGAAFWPQTKSMVFYENNDGSTQLLEKPWNFCGFSLSVRF